LTKASSFAGLVVVHLVLVLRFRRDHSYQYWWSNVASAMAGFAAGVLAVHGVHPGWYQAVRAGLDYMQLLQGHNLAQSLQVLLADAWLATCSSLVVLVLAGRLVRALQRNATELETVGIARLVLVLTALVAGAITWTARNLMWWPLLTALACLLLFVERSRAQTQSHPAGHRTNELFAASCILPLVYSVGTNNAIAWHSNMAGVFGFAACSALLARLRTQHVLGPRLFYLALSLLCIPVLWHQLQPWIDVAHVYRLRTSLGHQSQELAEPCHGVRVDAVTREDLALLQQGMVQAGFASGDPVLDFTGDGPGLTFVVGGKPVGPAWLLGGYPGSEQAAAHLLGLVDSVLIQRAWILASADSARAIPNWDRMVPPCGRVRVAQLPFTTSYSWGKNKTLQRNVTVWSPCRGQ
jgi:hypothetical protein